MSRNGKARTIRVQESTWQDLASMGRFGMSADELIQELLSKVKESSTMIAVRIGER
jgi:predicted CopG family antitoxin